MCDGADVGRRAAVAWRWRLGGFLLVLLVGLSLWRLTVLDLDNNIEHMLPASPAVIDDIRFLRQSGFSGQVILSLSLPDPQADPDALLAAADRLSGTLPGEWISEVRTGIPSGDLATDWASLLPLIPQMITSEAMDALQAEWTPEGIDRRIGALYRRLMAPGSSMGRFLAADPLGLAGGVLSAVQERMTAFGYRVNVAGGHLLSEDERHVLLVLKTPVPGTDGFGSRALLDHIATALAADPARPRAAIVSAHRHTVSNEDVIRGDVRRIGLAAAAGFFLLLLGVFRDRRAGWIFFTPIIAILFSIALSSFLLGTLSYFILGMSAVLAGIAMDYAVHMYVAKRIAGAAIVRSVARPVTVGACTTAAVFVAFFFSSVPGYGQLACFSVIGLFLCLLLSLFLLPRVVCTRPGAWRAWQWTDRRPTRRPRQRFIAGAWLLSIVLLAWAATRIEFQQDIEQFDGSCESVFRDERDFHKVWGGENPPAMLVVEGEDFEAVWERYEAVSRHAAERVGPQQLITLAALWPSQATRMRRLERWRDFWSAQGDAIRAAMTDAQRKYGFSDPAFAPFFEWVDGADVADGMPANGIWHGLRDRFALTDGDRSWALAYVADTPENLRKLSALESREGPVTVRLISRNALARHISEAVAAETLRLAVMAGVLILVPLCLLLRNLRRVLLALVPVVTALCAILGVLPLLGLSLSAASLVAAMIVVGLVIDYGVYMVLDETHRVSGAEAGSAAQRSTVTAFAIHLSVGTTLVGAGALLFARHPVMLAIGVTLVIGVAAGYLSAMWVTPALFRCTGGRSGE